MINPWNRLVRPVSMMLTALSFAITALAPATARADDAAPAIYLQAATDAYNMIRDASPGDIATAVSAAAVLQAGTGQTQPEILADLKLKPPDYDDARTRLQTLIAALRQPADTADPTLAQSRLHQVLAMHRYDALHRAPSLLDRFTQWVGERIKQLLRELFGGAGGPQTPAWVLYLVGAAVVGATAVFVFLSARGRFTAAIGIDRPFGPRAPADYFAEADRLAARGDRVGAIRALCAGVAATLAGERTWEGSPLTVREIFQRAPDPRSLQPLLQPFEGAVYGGREVDQATYEHAMRVAAPYREGVAVAA